MCKRLHAEQQLREIKAKPLNTEGTGEHRGDTTLAKNWRWLTLSKHLNMRERTGVPVH